MKTKRFLFAAGFVLAMAFIFSCTSVDEPEIPSPGVSSSFNEEKVSSSSTKSGGEEEYNYCVFMDYKVCTSGSFSSCPSGGILSNDCPYSNIPDNSSSSGIKYSLSSSSITPSSSSRLSNNSSAAGGNVSSSSRQLSSSSVALSSSSVATNSSSSSSNIGTFTDSRDGKTYKSVKIGEQVWMAENLNYNASGSLCYENNSSNCTTYGRLYDWATAMNVCPTDWHLPSDTEWDILFTSVGGQTTAGKQLKAANILDWNGGQDTYEFAALPGGYGNSDGDFYGVGKDGYWWSATEYNASNAYCRIMDYRSEDVIRGNYSLKTHLQSVRCVHD